MLESEFKISITSPGRRFGKSQKLSELIEKTIASGGTIVLESNNVVKKQHSLQEIMLMEQELIMKRFKTSELGRSICSRMTPPPKPNPIIIMSNPTRDS